MLREDQIQRYSRQILLREVGGRGQQKLLATPVGVHGASPALDVAIAYLAAGGSPLVLDTTPGGFLAGVSLEALSPDARSTAAPRITLAAAPLDALPLVVVTDREVAWRLEGSCPKCTWGPLSATADGAHSVFLGSLAALIAQRCALGRLDPLGHLRWDGNELRPGLVSCADHQISQ